jgi:hypothetical protein
MTYINVSRCPGLSTLCLKAFSGFYPASYMMTNNEKEIQTAAKNMIDRYGDNALREVDLRVLELESRNQQEALRLWREIRKRVELLVLPSTGNTKH